MNINGRLVALKVEHNLVYKHRQFYTSCAYTLVYETHTQRELINHCGLLSRFKHYKTLQLFLPMSEAAEFLLKLGTYTVQCLSLFISQRYFRVRIEFFDIKEDPIFCITSYSLNIKQHLSQG